MNAMQPRTKRYGLCALSALLAVLILWPVSPISWPVDVFAAAPAEVETAKAAVGTNNSTKNTVSYTTPTVAGETQVACVVFPYDATLVSVVDDQSETFSTVWSARFTGGGVTATNVYLVYFANSAASAQTLTVTSSTSASDIRGGIIATHLSGVAAASLDQAVTPVSGGATAWTSNTSGTTSRANEILIGCAFARLDTYNGTNATLSATGSWTQDIYIGAASSTPYDGNGNAVSFAHQVVAATGTYAYTGNTSAGTSVYSNFPGLATFQEPASGATPKGRLLLLGVGSQITRRIVEMLRGNGAL